MEPNIEKTSASHLFKACAFVREEPSRNLLKEGTVQVSNNETKMNGYEQNYNKPANNRGEVALMQAGPYGKLVLLEYEEQPHPYQVLIASLNHFHIPFHLEYKAEYSSMLCNVFVNNQLLSSSSGFNRKDARDKAVGKAYNKLKEMCYVLKIKGGINSDDPVVERDHLKQFEPTFTPEKKEGNSLDIPLEENIGSKLMRAMGWTGGGLGKDRQGIQEPIRPTVLVRRGGIGVLDVKSAKEFEKKIFKILEEYKLSKETHSLTFSSDFTKEERVVAHQMSQKLKLKSRSYGHGDDRKLVVSQKNNFGKVVEDMLLLGEYSNSKFQLIKPSIALPPENEQHAQLNCENNVKCEDAIVSGIETSAQVPENHPPLAVTENICPVTVQSIDVAMRNVVCERSQRSVDNITGPFGSFVLIEDEIVVTPIQLIKRSAHECHIPFKFEYGNVEKGGVVCRLLINNILVASSTEVTKKRARDMTISRSLVKLKDVCYTLKVRIQQGSLLTVQQTNQEFLNRDE
ncbi:uncharacterized protein GBIM_05176 [Gryllus bimaculatus]|nr:uncharacterized protein GBIM_05176 [Gryllus bimaculatus]